MREALFYSKEDKGIRCSLCPNFCLIEKGGTGQCNTRINNDERLIAKGYGKISAMAMDPIEKKPLYHFYPGSEILSVGSIWCNLKCSFCQNWHIAHRQQNTQFISPEHLVSIAHNHGSIGIAFTYNEPIINYEYILDTAKLAKERNLKIVMVTNGYIMTEPLRKILPFIDAMNIDIKGFTQEYYKEVCGGSLKPIKAAVEIAVQSCHIELTTLVVEGLNDEISSMRRLFEWIKGLDQNIPLHLSRYFPHYQMDKPATSVETMISLRELGKEYLSYVYLGNIPGADNNTYCPACGHLLIDRAYYNAVNTGISNGRCSKCNNLVPVIF